MAFDVTAFRSTLIGDGARPNLFDVQLQFPGWVFGGGTAGSKSTFMVKSSQLPGSTIGIAPLFYFGREVKLAGNRTFADWTIQVINDEDFSIRNAFEQWINGINDPVGNIRNPNADIVDGGYGVDAYVTQYSKTGDIIKQIVLVGMFPVDVAPLDLDWGSNDTIQEYPVTLAFQYWFDPTFPQTPAPLP